MGTAIHPDVLAAARTGAGWAFERLYGTVAPAVAGYLRALGARDPDSTVSEVFLRVFRGLPDFDGDAAGFRSWVFVIAHNLVLDERRYLGRRADEVCVDVIPEARLAGVAPDAADEALARLGESQAIRLLALLSPDQRDVLVLRFMADLSLEDTAAATRRTVTAVKALQRRGLDALRRRLEEISPLPVSPAPGSTLTET